MVRIDLDSPEVVQSGDGHQEQLDSSPIDGDSIQVQRLDAIRHLHSHLQRFWNEHEPAVRHVWQAMSIERRRELYQIIKPEQAESASHPYLVINSRKIPVEAANASLIPELSLESIIDNLLGLFSSWALPPLDIVAWECLKYVRFCLEKGTVKARTEDQDDRDGFCFILGERLGQCAKMRYDADAKNKLAMDRCMRRGVICSLAEFSLVQDRLVSILLGLVAITNEFGKALMTAVEFQAVDIYPEPYTAIADK